MLLGSRIDIDPSGVVDPSRFPPLHEPLHPELRSMAHGLALEMLRAVSEELCAARDEAAVARREVLRVGAAVEELRSQIRRGPLAGSGGQELVPRKGFLSSSDNADSAASAGLATFAVEPDVTVPVTLGNEIVNANPIVQGQKMRAATNCNLGNDSIIEVQAIVTSESLAMSGSNEIRTTTHGRKTEQSSTDISQVCGDSCAATETLAILGVCMLGFVFEALMTVEDGDHPLTAVYMMALSCSASLSCFVVAFTVLECYYLHMTRGALSMAGKSPIFVTDFESVLDGFKGLRAHVRNSVWASLCLILIAAVLRVCKRMGDSTAWRTMLPLNIVVLLVGVALVLGCVRRFRAAYRPLLRHMARHM